MTRATAVWLAIAAAVIVTGLVVHEMGVGLSAEARDFAGDALWAVMIFAFIGAMRPASRLVARAAVVLVVCWAVELSQAYHTPWLDTVRATTLGRLTLGTGFDARDLLAYTLGVAVAAIIERTVRREC